MAWIGGRKGFVLGGGNAKSISKMAGDLPAGIETGGSTLSRDITAILMGRGSQAGGSQGARRANAGAQSMPQDMKLPAWLKTGESIWYLSRRSGHKVEVIVEMVNTAKCEVE